MKLIIETPEGTREIDYAKLSLTSPGGMLSGAPKMSFFNVNYTLGWLMVPFDELRRCV